jgi:hypothetical protein
MRTRAWPEPFRERPMTDIRAMYENSVKAHSEAGYLLDVLGSIERSPALPMLAVSTSMHDLVVTDRALGDPPVEVVVVRAPGSIRSASGPGLVRVEHLSHTGRNDVIERPTSEAVPLFWRFVSEKFGISAAGPVSD